MVTSARLFGYMLAAVGFVHIAPAAAPPRTAPHLSRVAPAEVQRRKAQLDSRLLPSGGALVAVDDHQVFRLDLPSGNAITFVPAVYELNHGSSFADCGVYLVNSGTAQARFLSTLNHEHTLPELINCGGVQAVGLMPADGTRPRVLLLYSVYSPHVNLSAGVVLAWAETSQTYEVDRILGSDREPVRSIADIRLQLSQAH